MVICNKLNYLKSGDYLWNLWLIVYTETFVSVVSRLRMRPFEESLGRLMRSYRTRLRTEIFLLSKPRLIETRNSCSTKFPNKKWTHNFYMAPYDPCIPFILTSYTYQLHVFRAGQKLECILQKRWGADWVK